MQKTKSRAPIRAGSATALCGAIATVLAFSAFHSEAQESNALIDALVRKGVLTTKEGEEIRAEVQKDTATNTSAGKLKLSNSIQELKLYGDLRLRYQYDNKDAQLDSPGVGVNNPLEERNSSGAQRSRWRFKLRLNADFKLAENVFGGVELQTGYVSDGANQTFQDGFADYPIFISKAYLGWSPTEWLTLTAGKLPNPFYSTDLVWDPDINPSGVTEQVAFHKFSFGSGAAAGGYSKDGKSSAAPEIRSEHAWELTLVAGQFIFDDNDENLSDNDASTDAYVFQTQLIAAYKFNGNFKLTIAPAWLVENAGSVTQGTATRDVFGPINENDFRDSGFVSGATRNINLLLLPGDLTFKIAGLKTKVYWDLAYNIEGRKRTENIYLLTSLVPPVHGELDPDDRIKNHSNRDDVAFLVGLQLGENKKKGDWSALVNYRETGIGAVDPNLNDSDFALGELNTRGFKFGLAYNLTDFAVFGVTYMTAWQLRDIRGGEATGDNAIAESNAVQVLQVDLNVKF